MSKKNDSISEKVQDKEKASKIFFQHSIIISVVLIVVLLAALGAGFYYYLQYQKAQELLKNPTLGAQVETQNIISKVGSLMDLPKNEQPTIATVSDISKLKDQPFFAKAKNGDKVLIYPKSKKAILYDPTSNKIIEVQSINIGEASPTPSAPQQPLKVVLLNGTKISGLANTVEKQLTAQDTNVTVVSKGNAKAAYTKTLVVDLTGKQASGASEIAAALNGEVGKLPAGEVKPVNADILVILGGK